MMRLICYKARFSRGTFECISVSLHLRWNPYQDTSTAEMGLEVISLVFRRLRAPAKLLKALNRAR